MLTLGFKIDLAEMYAAQRYMDRMVDRANMWALREVGRQCKRAARPLAPKLSGRLESSITTRKNLKKVDDHHYRNTVGPRGFSHLYAPREEEMHGFMAAAVAQVSPKFPQILESAQRRVLAKYG